MRIKVEKPQAAKIAERERCPMPTKKMSVFPWEYDASETGSVLEGEVTVTTAGATRRCSGRAIRAPMVSRPPSPLAQGTLEAGHKPPVLRKNYVRLRPFSNISSTERLMTTAVCSFMAARISAWNSGLLTMREMCQDE